MKREKDLNLNSAIKKKSARRKEKKKHELKLVWRIFLLNAFSIYTGALFIRHGWSPIISDNIYIKGNESFSKVELLEASKISIPERLLNINPKSIQNNLLNHLPLRAVSVHRWLFPPSLSIEIQEKSPIAFAKKAKTLGSEEGMLDIDSSWIPIQFKTQMDTASIDLSIDGWASNKKELITFILKRRNSLGSPLKKIILSPNGEISLQTDQFSSISLGSDHSLLRKQLKTLSHLNQSLPLEILKKKLTIINLRDPLKPKIYTPQKQLL